MASISSTFTLAVKSSTNPPPGQNVGSPFPMPSVSYSLVINGPNTLTGRVTVDGNWPHEIDINSGRYVPGNSVVVQYMVDGKPASPYIVGPQNTPSRLAPNFPWTFDSATLSNGTHFITMRFVDTNSGVSAFHFGCRPIVVLVQNPAGTKVGDYSGAQLVPTGMVVAPGLFSNYTSPLPDFVTYPGAPQPMNAYPRPPKKIPPTNDPKYRDNGYLYFEDMSSMKSQEYVGTPIFATTLQGGVYIDYTNVDTGGGTVEDFYPIAFRSATRPGKRCNALTTPISTLIADPSDTGYFMTTLQGGLYHFSWDGEATLLAGIAWDPTKLAFNNYYARDNANEDQTLAQCQIKATITGFDTDDFGGLNDLCLDPRDPTNKTFYLANYIYSFIIKVDLNFDPPRCSVYAGQPDVKGYANTTTGARNALFNNISSVLMCDGTVPGLTIGTMLVADYNNDAIRRISPDGMTVSTLCGNQVSKPTGDQLLDQSVSDTWSPPGSVSFIPGNDISGAYINRPFTIQWASNNPSQRRLVLYESFTSTLRVIDLAANTVSRIPNTRGIGNIGRPYNGWAWASVDRMGVLGPKDDIVVANGVGAGAPYLRASIDGSSVGDWIGDGAGRLAEGYGAGPVFAAMPIYGWAACFSETRSHFVGGGFRYWGLYAARPLDPSDPPINVDARVGLNIDVFDKAGVRSPGLWFNGTSMCFPLGSRPSFASLYGELGNGLLGSSVVPNFDDLSRQYPTDGDFTAEVCAPGTLGRYLQDGGAGKTPRPELTGNDLQVLCYYIRRVALSGTYPTTATPGPTNTDSVVPQLTGLSAAQISNDSFGNPRIQVTWKTDKRTIGMAVAGSAAQQGTDVPYNCPSPIEASFGTDHSAVVSGLPKTNIINYCVIAKDVKGNSVYSTNQTISVA